MCVNHLSNGGGGGIFSLLKPDLQNSNRNEKVLPFVL